MKQKKLLALLSLSCILSLATGCSDTSSSSPSSNSSTTLETSSTESSYSSSTDSSSISTSDGEYDPNWQPGANALEGATQPQVKNPQGVTTVLGQMRASSNEAGLPQQGKANILVVPVQFELENDTNSDANDLISETDRTTLNETYESVASYYSASSNNLLELNVVTSPVVSLPNDIAAYSALAYSQGQEVALSSITSYIYDYLFNETETYYSHDFDADDDGKIDNLVIAYSWSNGSWNLGTDYDAIYEALLAEGTFFNLTDNVDSLTWTSAKVDGNHGLNSYVREVGRALGLSYYYDSYKERAPLANTDIMDDGLVGDQNPFSKYQLGWISPEVYTPSDLEQNQVVTLTSNNPIILSYEDVDTFGEYLILDFVTPSDDSVFTTLGIRVYEVDSRLVKEYNGFYYPYTYTGDEDFTDGNYTYSYSNDATNPLNAYGIDQAFPLVSLLDSDGINRHVVDASVSFNDSDLFVTGDSFGTESVVDGFYENFRFHGDAFNGPELGIIFTVDNVTEEGATITLRRAD